jgi:hypothetical protein
VLIVGFDSVAGVTGSREIPVDAFVLKWVTCKAYHGVGAGRHSQTSRIHRNMGEGSGGQQSA